MVVMMIMIMIALLGLMIRMMNYSPPKATFVLQGFCCEAPSCCEISYWQVSWLELRSEKCNVEPSELHCSVWKDWCCSVGSSVGRPGWWASRLAWGPSRPRWNQSIWQQPTSPRPLASPHSLSPSQITVIIARVHYNHHYHHHTIFSTSPTTTLISFKEHAKISSKLRKQIDEGFDHVEY